MPCTGLFITWTGMYCIHGSVYMKLWMNRSGCSKQAWHDLAKLILSCKAVQDMLPKLCIAYISIVIAWCRACLYLMFGRHA